MSRTISKHWPRSAPWGDKVAMCDLCGVHWRLSQLREMPNGQLWCPDEGRGRDGLTLARANAAQAPRGHFVSPGRKGGYDGRVDPDEVSEHITDFEDAER